jgi:integrase/recombinase XerD
VGFYEFLTARKAGEIEAVFGVRLESPLDEFNAARHAACEAAPATAPPSLARLAEFFEFLPGRVATARKFGSAGRDYALYRTLYHAGLRAEEAASLELPDLHFGRGPFGKIHVRFGKGAKTSGPRPRWVPMLDGLDLILRWFTDDVRTRFAASAALSCDQGGGRLHRGTIRNRASSQGRRPLTDKAIWPTPPAGAWNSVGKARHAMRAIDPRWASSRSCHAAGVRRG